METFKILIYTFMVCFSFCFTFDIHNRKHIFFAALGGVISWVSYLAFIPLGNDLLAYFFATVAISAYSELMARIFKAPVTGFMLVAVLPLVPGGGIYYTMEYCISGDTSAFIETGLHTFGIAGVIAAGVLMVSSVVRLFQTVNKERHLRKG